MTQLSCFAHYRVDYRATAFYIDIKVLATKSYWTFNRLDSVHCSLKPFNLLVKISSATVHKNLDWSNLNLKNETDNLLSNCLLVKLVIEAMKSTICQIQRK